MRYSVTRLCGGKALMVSPEKDLGLDLAKAAETLSAVGDLGRFDGAMVTMSWEGMEVTLYAQGKIMFFPLEDRDAAVDKAKYLLGLVSGI
ncbi:MAG: hypothetical protein GX224_02055 [Thermoplasmatales archaeon]|nr:hypothetical protein [Thermoplasmatales archaeon]